MSLRHPAPSRRASGAYLQAARLEQSLTLR